VLPRADDVLARADDVLARADDVLTRADDVLARANDFLTRAHRLKGRESLPESGDRPHIYSIPATNTTGLCFGLFDDFAPL
jgi:hypothetical protein